MTECTCEPGDSKSYKNVIAPCPIHWPDVRIAQQTVEWSGKFYALGCNVLDVSVNKYTDKLVFMVEIP